MKILVVLTSHDVLGNTGLKTGFWLERRDRSCSIQNRRGFHVVAS